jgi:hypothetical protein
MYTNNNSLYINNIFNETHPELTDLYENLQELQNNFMRTSSENIKTENIIENEIEDFHDDFFDNEINNKVFSDIEIEKFKNIYNNEPIEESEFNELEVDCEKLNEKNEKAKNYIINILKGDCCNKKCLEKIIQEVAILRYQNYINLTKDQQNMFLMGIISTSTRNSTTSTSDYLTMVYVFDGVDICNNAFLKLYCLSKNRFAALKNHYKNNDIIPRIHLSKGKKVSHKLTFETILKVLTFLKIYADANGLPSPGKTKNMYYLISINNLFFF